MSLERGQSGRVASHRPQQASGLALVVLVLILVLMSTACGTTKALKLPAQDTRNTCPVTRTEDREHEPPAALVRETNGDSDFFGQETLWVSLPRPDVRAEPRPDGSFSVKVGWWTLKDGQLRVRGSRLDGPGTFSAEVPGGRGYRGFRPTGMLFSELGCWRVTGTLGETELEFVLRVTN